MHERIQIEVAASALEAFVVIATGERVDFDAALADMRSGLAEAGVIFGVHERALTNAAARLSEDLEDVERHPVAFAESPVPGTPAALTPALELGIKPGVPRDDGTVDYRDRSLLQPVEADTLLATYRPPVPAQDGTGVDGSAIPPPAQDTGRLQLGSGAESTGDGLVYSTIAGVVKWDGALSIDVVAHVTHNGDVDFASGHLRMEGDITINGTVQEGFGVRATGDVEIRGDVDGGTVIAGGDVQIGGVIIGESALVSAAGHVTARRVQNAVVRSRSRVELQIDAIEAHTSGAEVVVNGIVRGGRTEAETAVVVKEAGGAAIGAHLAVGKPTEWPEDLAQSLARLAASRRYGSKSLDRRSRAGSHRRADGASRAEEAVRDAQLRERQRTAIQMARVDVSGTAAAGVTIEVGDRRKTLLDPIRGARFRLDPRRDIIIFEEL